MTTEEVNTAVENLIERGSFFKRYEGKDNYGKLKREYLEKLVQMIDKELQEEAQKMIWLSAYANNNPRSDYHWQCDACYDEGERRGKPEIYNRAYKAVEKEVKE